MKNTLIRIVMLTALIAVALIGTTNPSTVLGAKPVSEYVDVVLLQCTNATYQVNVEVRFYVERHTDPIGVAVASCPMQQIPVPGIYWDADSMLPYRGKPTRWEALLTFYDPVTGVGYCSFLETGTSFPEIIPPQSCGQDTATVTIGTPRVFP